MPSIFKISLLLLFFVFLGACADNQGLSFTTPAKIYENRGVKVSYPERWKLVGDGPSIKANRLTSFELPGGSVVTIMFYQSKPTEIE